MAVTRSVTFQDIAMQDYDTHKEIAHPGNPISDDVLRINSIIAENENFVEDELCPNCLCAHKWKGSQLETQKRGLTFEASNTLISEQERKVTIHIERCPKCSYEAHKYVYGAWKDIPIHVQCTATTVGPINVTYSNSGPLKVELKYDGANSGSTIF